MLAQKFVVKVGASMLSSIFLFVSLMVMTRYVGYEYSEMMWGWALIGLFNTLSDLGFNAATVKYISEGRDQNTCISTHLYLKVILIGIIIAVSVAYMIFFGVVNDTLDFERTKILLIFLAYYVISDLMWVMIYTFDGRLEAGRSSIIQASEGIIRSIILIVMAVMCVSADVLSMGYVLGIISSIAIAAYLFRGLKFKYVKPIYVKDYISFAKPVAVGLLLVTSITFIDKLFVEHFDGIMELGYYSAAMGIVYAVTAIGVALNFILLPQMSEMFISKKHEELRDVLWKSEKYISMIILPFIVFMCVFGDSLAITVLGAEYADAGNLISILALYIYINILLGILTQVLYSTNNNSLYRNATIVYAAFTFLFLFILVPENLGPMTMIGLGAEGAAAAVTIGYFAFLLITSYYVKRSTGLTMYKGLVKHYVAGAITFAILFLVRSPEPLGLIPLILFLLLALLIFYAIMFVIKGIRMSDVRFIISALNIKMLYDDAKEKE